MLEKRKRIINRELIETVKTLPCLACGVEPAGDAHHITTVRAGGDDIATNVMSLCRYHHSMYHSQGHSYMFWNYEVLRSWLRVAEREDIIVRVKTKGWYTPIAMERFKGYSRAKRRRNGKKRHTDQSD